MNIHRIIIIIVLLISKSSFAQYTYGLNELSVSLMNNICGVPFVRFTPVNPGIETGITFLQNDKTHTKQTVSAYLGYFYNKEIAHSIYLKTTYDFQYKIKQLIGLNAYAGIGYLHAIYPGDGYQFNQDTGNYESHHVNQAFFLSNIGLGIIYIKPKKIHPFIKYEMIMAGFDITNILTNFHIGLIISLNNPKKAEQ